LKGSVKSRLGRAPPRVWICLFCCLLFSQQNSAAASGLEDALQSALDTFQNHYAFPGATAACVLRDGTVGVAATGVADLETGTPMTPRSRMLAASIGKTFVGATAIALAREGVLNLDSPIYKWLSNQPWFARLPNHEAITLRHLLTHSSGLADHVHLESFVTAFSQEWRGKENTFPPERLIQFVLDRPPLFEVGKGWAYTDTGYLLIGLVIEKATGRSYYAEIRKRFLIPLDLTLTAPADQRYLPGLAAGYMATDNAFGLPRKTTIADGALAWHPGLEWTGGGLVSNSRDLARWGSIFFGGNAMSGACLDELLNSVSVGAETPDIRYGAGVAIYRTSPAGPVYGHGGWIPGHSSSLRYYPEHGITIAFQINTDIGVAGDTTSLMREMETGLAQTVISAARDLDTGH